MDIELDRDYSVLNMTARLAYRTDTSAMFELGWREDSLLLDGRTLAIPSFKVVGWLDIHYPCHGFNKLAIRALLHDAEDPLAAMKGVVGEVKHWLKLDDAVSYVVTLIIGDKHYWMQEPSDGIPSYTNRDSFDVPDGLLDLWRNHCRDRKE